MDGMTLMASAMSTAQARLDVATTNLAHAGVDGFHRTLVRARLQQNAIRLTYEADTHGTSVRRTGRAFDMTMVGGGTFATVHGTRLRSGSFERVADGRLITADGDALRGRSGALRVPIGAVIHADGAVFAGNREVDRVSVAPNTHLAIGYLEESNTNPASEMIEILNAQRSFETDQKTILAIDSVRNKDANEIGKPAQ